MLCFLTPLAVIKDETIVNNQDSSLKVPLFDLKPSECLLDAKISLVRIHQLIVPSTLLAPATEIRTRKATEIHTLKPPTYELFLQNSSKSNNYLMLSENFQ